jgi:predicted lipoprotein with Yx(FWY)xxD motif
MAGAKGAILIAVVALLGGCELIAVSYVPVQNQGDVLVDLQGMTLYTFDRDPRGQSLCDAACATRWPPLLAADDARPAGDYALVVHDDGRRQWMYQRKPLYRSAMDRQPGDRIGHGVDNMWRIARP